MKKSVRVLARSETSSCGRYTSSKDRFPFFYLEKRKRDRNAADRRREINRGDVGR